MANSKITSDPELTTPDDADILPIIDDPSGTPTNKKITAKNLVQKVLDGLGFSTATVATGDKVLIQDADDSDNVKTATAQSIADLKTTELSEDTTPQLGGTLDAQGNNIDDLADITFRTGGQGGVIQTGTSVADKFVIKIYDTGLGAYKNIIEGDAGNPAKMQIVVDRIDFEDETDNTKIMDLDLSGITTGTTRTMSIPDKDFTPTANEDTDVSGNSWVLDEDDMSSDDATKVPTQQSVKAYVDTTADAGKKVGTFTASASTGNQSITGVGFQPKLVEFRCVEEVTDRLSTCSGWATSSTARGFILSTSDQGTIGDQAVEDSTTNCIKTLDNVGGTRREADFVSMDADGFTINWGTADTGITIHYIAHE